MDTHNSILKALRGVIHHNSAVKQQFKLPESLMREVRQAVDLIANSEVSERCPECRATRSNHEFTAARCQNDKVTR